MKISRLSEAERLPSDDGSTLVIVGSFAPVHLAHLDRIMAAERALIRNNEKVNAAVFAPNSDSYVVRQKLRDEPGDWSFDRRVREFGKMDISTTAPSFVDDITGQKPPERSISEEVIDTVADHLGIQACRAVLVTGSDQISSMEPFVEEGRAICIMRAGYDENVENAMQQKWLRDAVNRGSYIIAPPMNPDLDISSTAIRAAMSNSPTI
jgi:nicotinic acid mononucleotide adenylyltransferase